MSCLKASSAAMGDTRKSKRCWFPFPAGIAMIISGCAVGPSYQPPDILMPSSFGGHRRYQPMQGLRPRVQAQRSAHVALWPIAHFGAVRNLIATGA
jgi:hypothetical protein